MTQSIEMACSGDSPTAGQPLNQAAPANREDLGILLYYKYIVLEGSDAVSVARWYEDLCKRLALNGRIRVARDGINVTVRGSMAALRAHAAAVTAHPLLRGGDIDFKLAPSHGSRNDATLHETQMDTLVVRLCEELVTLGPLARHRADPRAHTAPHLTPEQFHRLLSRAADAADSKPDASSEAAGAEGVGVAGSGEASTEGAGAAADAAAGCGGDGAAGGKEGTEGTAADAGSVVLIDARNIYETRIGHFEVAPGVHTLDPRTRCFSDLPAWMDSHEAQLRNRTVLMYCTGGVRCERASAYLREKGPEFSQVFQLSGGIHRYLEAFPDGGFFRGKNFLYDDRIAVGPEGVEPQSPSAVVGRCQLCDCPWDDYGARLRCSRCRLLLLVCDQCASSAALQPQPANDEGVAAAEEEGASPCITSPSAASPSAATRSCVGLMCELCSELCHGGGAGGGGGDTLNGSGGRAGRGLGLRSPKGAAVPPPPPPPRRMGSPPSEGATQPPPSANLSSIIEGPLPSIPIIIIPGAAATTTTSPPRIPGTATTTTTTTNNTNSTSSTAEVAAAGGAVHAATQPGSQAPPAMSPGAQGATATGVQVAQQQQQQQNQNQERRRLRILCLHGFRQTGKQFQGRTCALRKKLRDLADFVFLDAPHSLPLFVKEEGAATEAAAVLPAAAEAVGAEGRGEVEGAANGGAGGDVVLGEGDGDGERYWFGSDDGKADDGGGSAEAAAVAGRKAVAAPAAAAAKRAWLLPPELYHPATEGPGVPGVTEGEGEGEAVAPPGYMAAPSYVDELQYTRQTEGWEESLAAVQRAVRELGPFDGVFGFSQGASVAAVLCALQQEQEPQQLGDTSSSSVSSASPINNNNNNNAFGFRFAILASGFPSPLPQHADLLARVGPVELPSLHVYGSAAASSPATAAANSTPPAATAADSGGNDGADGGGSSSSRGDRQIPPRESERLAGFFSCGRGQRRALCHQCGHLIPATRSHAATFREFLEAQRAALEE